MKKGICVDEWIKIWFEKIEEKSHTVMENGFNTILSNFSSTLLFLFLSLLEFSWPVLERVIAPRRLLWNKKEVLLKSASGENFSLELSD